MRAGESISDSLGQRWCWFWPPCNWHYPPGAIVYATAGKRRRKASLCSPKRARAIGDGTRDPSVLQISSWKRLAIKNNPCVDVILNSLPGEAISKGMGILKTGRAFLGDRVSETSTMTLASACMRCETTSRYLPLTSINFSNNSLHVWARCFANWSGRFDAGRVATCGDEELLRPPTILGLHFVFMQQGKHIGKVACQLQRQTDRSFCRRLCSHRVSQRCNLLDRRWSGWDSVCKSRSGWPVAGQGSLGPFQSQAIEIRLKLKRSRISLCLMEPRLAFCLPT